MSRNIHIIYVVMEVTRQQSSKLIIMWWQIGTQHETAINVNIIRFGKHRKKEEEKNVNIISFIEQTNTQNIDVNIIHFCKKQTPKKHKRLQNWKDSGNSRNCEYFTNFDCFVLLGWIFIVNSTHFWLTMKISWILLGLLMLNNILTVLSIQEVCLVRRGPELAGLGVRFH